MAECSKEKGGQESEMPGKRRAGRGGTLCVSFVAGFRLQ